MREGSLADSLSQDAFAAMLDLSIGQILSKVYSTLEQPVQGTDDEVRHSDLKRAYFNLLLSISTAGYAKIFVSPRMSLQSLVEWIV